MRQLDGRWQAVGLTLRFTDGIPASMRLEPPVAQFLGSLDGRKTLGEVIGEFAQEVRADLAVVERECVNLTRMLVERRFVVM
jgi:cytosine/adenosine deaminase-related metal-dependent hydrolase